MKLRLIDIFAGVAYTIIGLFVMALLWSVLVGNHQRNVERDKYLFTHCKSVAQKTGLFSAYYECEDRAEGEK